MTTKGAVTQPPAASPAQRDHPPIWQRITEAASIVALLLGVLLSLPLLLLVAGTEARIAEEMDQR